MRIEINVGPIGLDKPDNYQAVFHAKLTEPDIYKLYKMLWSLTRDLFDLEQCASCGKWGDASFITLSLGDIFHCKDCACGTIKIT
jgi:hypothetical protein